LTLMIDQHLEEIDEALARLEHGRYGVCARCGQPIAPRRLQALPAAALCVRCQGAADRQPGRGGWGASPR
jgi:RNA polymerase-binding transcription factor DksA